MAKTDAIVSVDVPAGDYASIRLFEKDAETLYIQAQCTNSYSVDIVWMDDDNNIVREETGVMGGALSGGEWNRTSMASYSARLEVRVNNDGVASGTVNASFKLI